MLLQAGVMLFCLLLRHRTAYYRYRSANEPRSSNDPLASMYSRDPPPALVETPTGVIARDISVNREARDVDEIYRTLLDADPKVQIRVLYRQPHSSSVVIGLIRVMTELGGGVQ